MGGRRMGDVQAERTFIVGVIHAARVAPDMVEMAEERDFTEPRLRLIFRVARGLSMNGEPPDRMAVRRAMEEMGQLSPEDEKLLEPPRGVSEEVLIERACDAADRMCALSHGVSAPGLARVDLGAGAAKETGTGTPGAWPKPTWENRDLALDGFTTVVREEFQLRWLWPGWLARGALTLLASSPGEGKSAVALEVIRCVTGQSKTWPDGGFCGLSGLCGAPATPATQAAQETVILVETEAAEAIWRSRVAAWGIDTSRLRVFESKNGEMGMAPLQLEREEDLLALDCAVTKTHPALVVIDSLSGAHGGDENTAAMRSLMLKLARIARDSQAAILAVHHFRKARGAESNSAALDRLRGSSSIGQVARCVWAIDRPDPGDPRRRLVQVKNNLAPMPEAVGFTIGATGVSFGKAPKPTTQAESAAEFIRTLLAAAPLGAAEARRQCREVGYGDKTVWNATRILGIVKTRETQTGPWLWCLPEAERPRGTPTE